MHFFYIRILVAASLFVALKAKNETTESGKGVWDFIMKNGPKFCKCLCGQANTNAERRLSTGPAIEAHEFPWLVLVNVQNVASITATLINDKYVITSASQVFGLTPYDVKILVGEHNRCHSDVTSANISVSAIIIHPEFDAHSRSNDVALLKLTTTLKMNRFIGSICLPKPGIYYQEKVVSVVGWGDRPTYASDSVESCHPRKVSIPILASNECLRLGNAAGVSLRDKGCAGIAGATSVACASDAGGPVQYLAEDGLYEMVGVLSDANVCFEGSTPTLFTRVNEHLNWIFQHTRDSCFCSK